MHPVEIHAMDSCMAQISKDRKIKRLQDIGNPMIRQPGGKQVYTLWKQN